MPEKIPENTYEDSSQKRARLTQESEEASKEAGCAIEVENKDKDNVNKIVQEIDDLNEQIKTLCLYQDKLLEEKYDIDQRYDQKKGLGKIDEELFSNHRNLLFVRNKLNELYIRRGNLSEDLVGAKGDHAGSDAISRSKVEKVEAIKKQLEELK